MTACNVISVQHVNEAFLAAPPLIDATILDLTLKFPVWLSDLWEMKSWPNGAGTKMEQLIFRGEMPEIERGFDKWGKVGNISGCEPCEPPSCGYNWTMFGGHAFQRKITELMEREFRTPTYCVKEIQTTAQFETVFPKIIQNIHAQVQFFKENSIGQNFLSMLSKKFIVDGGGAKCNTEDPYSYRNVGSPTVRLSALNISMLKFFYEQMRKIPDVIPYDTVDGRPIYALEASDDLIQNLYLDDPNLRQDLRFSGYANDLVTKYNFLSTIRGMFIPAPIDYPRRFNIVAGEPVEVLPFVRGVPGEVGTFTYLSEAYMLATHEEVLMHGMHPFTIFTKSTVTTLGAGSSFGPEPSFMESWKWVNPETVCDPFQREGFFASAANLGLSQQFSDGIFAVLVERPQIATMAMYTPNPVCPVVPPTCTNIVPDVGCPCPAVVSTSVDPISGNYFFTFATPTAGEADDPVLLELDTGVAVTGTLEAISTDGLTIEVSFADGVFSGSLLCHVIGIECQTTAACSATVMSTCDCRSGQTNAVKLTLSNPIVAQTAAQVLRVYFGDCTEANVVIVSVDAATATWTVRYATGYGPTDNPTGAGGPPATNAPLSADMICDRGGILKVCVPTATVGSCPACTGPTLTACVEEEEG